MRSYNKALIAAVVAFGIMVVTVLLTGCSSQTSDDLPPSLTNPVAATAPAQARAITAADPPPMVTTVKRVVDGDTVVVTLPNNGPEMKIRVIGIDTPETVDPRKPIQCWGPEASALAKQLLPVGSRVKVEADASQDLVDNRGTRAVRHIIMQDGHNFATVMIERGAGHVYVYDRRPDAHYADNVTAQARAKQGQVGVWGPPCNGKSWGE